MDSVEELQEQVGELAKVLQTFREGVLLLDEVDMVLHPLKSELNFPIGEKHPLDFSPERWTCAIHAIDAVFYLEAGRMSVPFHQSGRAHRILEELRAVIEDGYERREAPRQAAGRPWRRGAARGRLPARPRGSRAKLLLSRWLQRRGSSRDAGGRFRPWAPARARAPASPREPHAG